MNRTDEQKATDYTNMGSSVTVINNLIAGDVSVIGDITEAKRKEKVKRNYASLEVVKACLLYTSPSPRDGLLSRMPSSA